MFETHDGLSRDYEVSCTELDFLVDQVRDDDAVIGARMMGGGFGGCTINLVKEEAIDTPRGAGRTRLPGSYEERDEGICCADRRRHLRIIQ